MYAHGSCLYVHNDSTLLFVVSISLHAQRYIPAWESVPGTRYRSPRVTVFRYSEHQVPVVHNIGSSWWRTGCTTSSTGTDFTNQDSVHLIRVVQVWLARFYKTGILQRIWSRWINSIQPIRICVVTRELTLESFRTENYSAKHTYARLQVYENVFARTNSDSNILATVEKADRVDFLEEDCSTSTGFHEEWNR